VNLESTRFPRHSRKVSTKWTSNGKKKGKGNKKNGNRYLAWALSEASELARRYDPQARAAQFIMRDRVVFKPEKLFG